MMPVAKASVLVIAYTYPPMPTVGANRWDAMVRHLRLLGHDVTVVTTAAFGRSVDPAAERAVLRAGDLTSARALRRLLGRGPMPPPSDAPHGEAAPKPVAPLPEILQKIFVPDLYVAAWLPQAFRIAHGIVTGGQVDCVITTSPYESAHMVGPLLRRAGPAWVADFRDGWLFEPHRPRLPTGAQRRMDARLEMRVARTADRVVAATRPIAADFKQRLGVDAVQVSNGFDPLTCRDLPRVELPALGPDPVLLVHTGTLSGPAKDPRSLLAAMRQLREDDPPAGERLRLVLAGRLESEEHRVIEESGLGDQIVTLGQRSHAESLALQRQADGLVLITTSGWSGLTGKLFEYLAAGRPIVALAGAEIAGVIGATGTGVAVSPDDVEGITTQLSRLVRGQLAAAYQPRNLEPYVYPGPAVRMLRVIDEAVARRSSC